MAQTAAHGYNRGAMHWLALIDRETVGNLVTVLGILVAARVVIYQMDRQLGLQRDNAREELKLRVHELLARRARELSEAIVSAKMYAFLIPGELDVLEQHRKLGLKRSPSDKRAVDFAKLHHEAMDATTELLYDFGAWSIAFPGLEVFNTALMSATHDAREAFSPLHLALLQALPMDPPLDAPAHIQRPIVPLPLSNEQMAQLQKLVDGYVNAVDDLGCYVGDLIVESQNNLLSGLFERRVPLRKPIDPRCKVISTDPVKLKALLQYFNNETPWGKNVRETEESVRKSLNRESRT
jgi:hypothetical protein